MSPKNKPNKPAGNTISAGKPPADDAASVTQKSIKPKNQLYRWFFTLKESPVEKHISPSQLSQDLRSFCKEFYFQLEEGKDGYRHYQGCFSLNTKEFFNTVKNYFPNYIHLEAVTNWHASKLYVMKNESRLAGPWTHETVFIKDPLEGKTLYPWQQEITDLLKIEPNDREIIWLWDEKGNIGKTTFVKHMCINHPSKVIMVSGKASDIKYALSRDECNPRIVFFHYVRSQEGFVSYQAIEEIKDGLWFNQKYESKMVIKNPIHIIVLANFPPDEHALSQDRWNIKHISAGP